MKRIKKKKADYHKAVLRLEEALQEKETEIVIDGVLHRFEFTFELAWKTMKDYLEYTGVVEKTGSPRETLQNAYQYKLIINGDEWINMMLSRNSLSHLYDEEKSREIYVKIKEKYIKLLKDLDNKLDTL